MLMGSLDCSQMYKHSTTHRCHAAIPHLDVSFLLCLLCPHTCVSEPATEGPCLGLTSRGLGSSFRVLDKPVKGWEMARVVVTLLQGLGSGLMWWWP